MPYHFGVFPFVIGNCFGAYALACWSVLCIETSITVICVPRDSFFHFFSFFSSHIDPTKIKCELICLDMQEPYEYIPNGNTTFALHSNEHFFIAIFFCGCCCCCLCSTNSWKHYLAAIKRKKRHQIGTDLHRKFSKCLLI